MYAVIVIYLNWLYPLYHWGYRRILVLPVGRSRTIAQRKRRNFRKLDDPVSQGMIYKTQWFLFLFRGKFSENQALKRRELAIYQDLGDRCMTGIALAELAECTYNLGSMK